MSDEGYTVILGDRRYAVHRKWARLPAGESFGFISDLMVDQTGVACHTGAHNCFFRAWRDDELIEIAQPLVDPQQLYGHVNG